MHRCIADLTEIRGAVASARVRERMRGKPSAATVMSAPDVNMAEAVAAEAVAAEMTASVTAAKMAASMTTASMTTAAVAAAASREGGAGQRASHHKHRNSHSRSQHLNPPASAALRHRKLAGIGTSEEAESSGAVIV
jgi:hypothetical protein